MQIYDYILIGTSSVGCVLDNQLTENGNAVLVLEAGGEDKDQNIHIPAAVPKNFKSKNDWAYYSAPLESRFHQSL